MFKHYADLPGIDSTGMQSCNTPREYTPPKMHDDHIPSALRHFQNISPAGVFSESNELSSDVCGSQLRYSSLTQIV